MKRILTSIVAILLTAAMLAGCAAQEPNRGSINGVVYASSDAELTFIAPSGWEYATDEEIAEMYRNGLDFMGASKTEIADESSDKPVIHDMVATETETGTRVVVYYLNLATIRGGADYTEEDFLDFTKELLKTTRFNYIFGDYTDIEIGPNTYKVMPVTFTNYSISQYLYVRRKGDYMLCIIVAIPEGTDIDSIIANFSWIDGQTE